MKKDKNQLQRLQTIIENDRVNTGEDFIQLVVSDTEKLMHDYFDFRISPVLNIEKQGDGYLINLSFYAHRIKSFVKV